MNLDEDATGPARRGAEQPSSTAQHVQLIALNIDLEQVEPQTGEHVVQPY